MLSIKDYKLSFDLLRRISRISEFSRILDRDASLEWIGGLNELQRVNRSSRNSCLVIEEDEDVSDSYKRAIEQQYDHSEWLGRNPHSLFESDARRRKKVLSDAQSFTTEVVYSTIDELARSFNLDGGFSSSLPSVEVFGRREMRERYGESLKWAQYGEATLFGADSFSSKGRGELSHDIPVGPRIRLDLSLDISDRILEVVVEESFHFLHWFYETDPIIRELIRPNYNNKSSDVLEYGHLIEEEVDGSPIVRARIVGGTQNNKGLCLVLREAGAFFVRSLFGFNKKLQAPSNSDDPDFTLIDAIMFEGVNGVSRRLSKLDGVSDYFKKNVYTYLKKDMHFLGYNLGRRLYSVMSSDDDIQEVMDVFLNNRMHPEEKLTSLGNIYKSHVTGSN